MDKIYEKYILCESAEIKKTASKLIIQFARKINQLVISVPGKISDTFKFTNGNEILNDGVSLRVLDKNNNSLAEFPKPKINYKKAVAYALKGK